MAIPSGACLLLIKPCTIPKKRCNKTCTMLQYIAFFVLQLACVTSKQVHVVFGNHLDIGFDNIEPYIGYDSNVLNMYFNRYLPLAVDMSDYMQRVSPHHDRYVYTTHSYIISLFLECPASMGLQCPSAAVKTKVLRGIQTGAITWHAHPHNAQYEFYDPSLLEFSFTLTHNLDKRFGFNPKHTAILRDVPGLTRAVIPNLVRQGIKGVSVGVNAGSAPPGVPHHTPFIWRDEESDTQILAFWHPGGYGGIHGGVYLDPPDQCIQAPGLDHVLCTAWRNDNEGPPLTVLEPLRVYQLLRQEWSSAAGSSSNSNPGGSSSKSSCHRTALSRDHHLPTQSRAANISRATDPSHIFASSFDDFVDVVLDAVATQGLQLPVVTAEVGDTWIYGVQSDPLKTANFRAVSRARAACVADASCPSETAAFYEFSRLLLKVPEHTWGVDIKKTLHDFANYSNVDFHKCIQPVPALLQQPSAAVLPQHTANPTAAAAADGDRTGSSTYAAVIAAAGVGSSGDGVAMRKVPCINYQHCLHAWDRQAAYIDWAIKSLPGDHPVVQAYAADVAARQQLAHITHDQLTVAGAAVHTVGPARAEAAEATQEKTGPVSSADAGVKMQHSTHSGSTASIAQVQRSRSLKFVQEKQSLLQRRKQRQRQQQQRQYKCGSWMFTLDEQQGGLTSLRKMYGPDQSQPGIDWAGGNSSSKLGGSTSSRSRSLKAATSQTPCQGPRVHSADPMLQDGCQLSNSKDPAVGSSSSDVRGVLGQLRYSAYCEASYEFVWKYYAYQQPLPWWFPLDFGKVNSSAAWNKEVHVKAQLEQVFETFTQSGDLQHLALRSTFPQLLVQQFGAPEVMWTVITCPRGQGESASHGSSSSSSSSSTADDEDLQVAVIWQNKTPTRLPEALWFSFQPSPDAVDVNSWRLHKLGSLISPTEVVLNGSQSMHAVSEAGIQVDSADGSEKLQIKTLDTALVSPGHPNAFPNGAFIPCMTEGMHFNLVNNVWGTNYVMWVPYTTEDVNMAFRFGIHAERRQQQQQQQQQRRQQH